MLAQELTDAFVEQAGESGFQVVIDYVWGSPVEAFLAALTERICGYQVGDSVCSGRGKRRGDDLTSGSRAS
jgi:hypothetical protein